MLILNENGINNDTDDNEDFDISECSDRDIIEAQFRLCYEIYKITKECEGPLHEKFTWLKKEAEAPPTADYRKATLSRKLVTGAPILGFLLGLAALIILGLITLEVMPIDWELEWRWWFLAFPVIGFVALWLPARIRQAVRMRKLTSRVVREKEEADGRLRKEWEDKLPSLRAQIDEIKSTAAEYDKEIEEKAETLEWIAANGGLPQKYWDYEILMRMVTYFDEGRAESKKEAVSLYIQEEREGRQNEAIRQEREALRRQHEEMMQQQKEMQKQQAIHAANMRDAAERQAAAANRAADNAGIAAIFGAGILFKD